MDQAIYRILDANFNRAREAIRVVEDCARFVLDDSALSAKAKALRDGLRTVLDALPQDQLLTSRNTPGDVGTSITAPGEADRRDLTVVVSAACKRLTEALRTIEEYTKVVAPAQSPAVEQMRYAAYTLEQQLAHRLSIGEGLGGRGGLYAIVSSHLCRISLEATVTALIAGGASVIQLREKDLPDDQFFVEATLLRELTRGTATRFVVNDRPDIAALAGADGVHLGQDDLPVAQVRRLLRPGAIVGRSTHSLADVEAAAAEGADYIGFGAIFDTATKANPIEVGTQLLQDVLAARPASLPVVAVGGITLKTLSQVTRAGAKWVAVSSALCGAEDIQQVTADFVAALSE
jgi:thiamine-phosphate pyrophosphorylase